ncbi:MAG: hypothetical protein QG564_1823 [Campylobacterota bacterium]|nr:hypothetical protein [Campylobacterota bacterium]
MRTECMISKGELFELLGDKAFMFSMFLNGVEPEQKAIRFMFDNLNDINLKSPLIQTQMIPLLFSMNVIDQNCLDRINAFIFNAEL